MRLSIFIHGFSSDLGFNQPTIQSKGSNNVAASAPVNAKIAPPGYYITCALHSAGVPSVATITKVPGTSSSPPDDITAPAVGITSPVNGDTVLGPSTGVTVAVTGTTSDESDGSGIQKVEVKVGSNPFKLATPRA